MTSQPTFANASLLVAAGGGLGAWLRFLTGKAWMAVAAPAAAAFPWATLTANVVGSLAMGVLAGVMARHGAAASEGWRLLLGVGVLGGYTTFSAFSLEFALFVERGALGQAALYVAISLVAGFAALFAGLYAARVLA